MARVVWADRNNTVTQITILWNYGEHYNDGLEQLIYARMQLFNQQHKNHGPNMPCTSAIQAGGGSLMVWGMLSWHTLDLVIPMNHCLKSTVCLSIVADLVHFLIATIYQSSYGYFQHDNAPWHKAKVIF